MASSYCQCIDEMSVKTSLTRSKSLRVNEAVHDNTRFEFSSILCLHLLGPDAIHDTSNQHFDQRLEEFSIA